MCGISGIINSKGFQISNIRVMTDIVKHRGPDDEGFLIFEHLDSSPVCQGGASTPGEVYTSGFSYAPVAHKDQPETGLLAVVALGHRRLAILDLSPGGHQPMCDVDGRYWIAFNGEIYNYIELREELRKLNYSFITHTDTEVIIAAWRQWGPDCLKRFNGMWAICIYDRIGKKLFLARDRFGIKPLYYWFAPDGSFCFGSEIKQFTVLPGWRAVLNRQRAYDYLVYSYTDHTDETMFDGVLQIPGGYFLYAEIEKLKPDETKRLPLKQWYQLSHEPFQGTFEEAYSTFELLFKKSVELHLRSDVPVGSALSGGLDSTAIVCEINKLLENKHSDQLQKTFSACSQDERYDERKWIDIVVKNISAESFFVYPELDEVFETLPALIRYHDEPYQSQSPYFAFNVFKLAKSKNIKVMLNGQGADEYLGGYGQFSHARLSRKTRKFRWRGIFQEAKNSKKFIPYTSSFITKLMLVSFLPAKIKRMLAGSHKEVVLKNGLINNNILKAENRPANGLLFVNNPTIPEITDDGLFHSTLPKYLKWEDRNSMSNSIEVRVPFLYYKLVEFVYNLPEEYLDFAGERKKVMRHALKDILPKEIIDRKDKNGFITSEEKWVKEENPSLFREKIKEAIDHSLGIINPAALKYFDDVVSNKIPFDYTYWRLILFSAWLVQFNVQLN
jgi:asparagine synthase (glutamine-hydrolysing)